MKKVFIYIIFPVYVLSSVSCMSTKNDSVKMARDSNRTKVSIEQRYDAEFAVCIADAGMLEAQLADLAHQNATTSAAKELANIMDREHGKEHNELKVLAARKNITLPDKLSNRSQKAYDCVAKKNEEKFDKAYIRCTKKASKQELRKFKEEAKRGKEPEVKAWAAANVSSIKTQIIETKGACKKMKDGK